MQVEMCSAKTSTNKNEIELFLLAMQTLFVSNFIELKILVSDTL